MPTDDEKAKTLNNPPAWCNHPQRAVCGGVSKMGHNCLTCKHNTVDPRTDDNFDDWSGILEDVEGFSFIRCKDCKKDGCPERDNKTNKYGGCLQKIEETK